MREHGWVIGGVILLAAILQASLAPHLKILGVVPNLFLLVVVTLALVEGPVAGCVAGFAAGLTLDLLGTGPLGAWPLVLTVVGYLAGMLQSNLFAEGWLLPVTAVFVAGVTAELSYALLLSILGVGGDLVAEILRLVLPGAVYNTALAVLAYPWLARVLSQDRAVATLRRMR